jgi:hypothetical protein
MSALWLIPAVLAGAISAIPVAGEDTCKTSADGRAWHAAQGQTIRVKVDMPAKEVWLWINPVSGFASMIETVGAETWCWRADMRLPTRTLVGLVYPQAIP